MDLAEGEGVVMIVPLRRGDNSSSFVVTLSKVNTT
jgi:hypothetical protein